MREIRTVVHYRAYPYNRDRYPVRSYIIYADTDEQAVEIAKQYVGAGEVEVCELRRTVALLTPETSER